MMGHALGSPSQIICDPEERRKWYDAHPIKTSAPTTIPVSPLWENLDLETQESATSGVQGIIDGNTPEQSHEGWVAFKLEHGWKFGPVKDEEKKEHPLLVPYSALPESQQIKDHLFSNVVHALIHA